MGGVLIGEWVWHLWEYLLVTFKDLYSATDNLDWGQKVGSAPSRSC